ncbi:MAG: endo-1,4-beta-xylanase [Thermogutta sp.]
MLYAELISRCLLDRVVMVFAIAALFGAVHSAGYADQATDQPADANGGSTERAGASLKDAFRDDFLVGMAGDLPGNYSERELDLIREQFNAATPENCMKPALVHPSEDQWRFERTDAFVQWCLSNKITAVHGHTLLWHHQTGDWFFRGDDRGLVIERMKNHIQTLVGRYKGKIRSWDVVNEAINDGGNAQTGQTENLRNTAWLQAVGPEYLTLAFKFAHEADPEALLFYNDYGIESGPKHASSMVLLRRLLREGAPIHGVGIQGHWSTRSIPYAELDQAISDYASLGLKVAVSELDVTIAGASGGQFDGGRGRRNIRPPTAQELQIQADAYAKLFAIFLKHTDVIDRVTFWGLNDGRTWRYGQHPLLFDADCQPKSAFHAVIEEAQRTSRP